MLDKKKKILFSAYSLEVGGIETALVNLLNYLEETNEYEITLVLEKKRGALLNALRKNIQVIEYSPSYNKLISKIINAVKRFKFTLKYKNKYDASFAYATYCKMASATSQIASQNSNLWVHSSYLGIFNNDENKYKDFFKKLNIHKFKNIVFVSNKSKCEFENVMNMNNTVLCNNIINYKEIEKKASEKIVETKSNKFTFLYVGRITEDSKKISRLLDVSRMLAEKNLDFRVLIVGDGKDMKKSKEYVKEHNLENYINFLGEKINPYPYFKISDALILVSENEGYPVVYNEAKVLHLPIITTDVSDSKTDIHKKYGIVCKQSTEDIFKTMENVIIKGIDSVIPELEIFNASEYNNNIARKIEQIINERN